MKDTIPEGKLIGDLILFAILILWFYKPFFWLARLIIAKAMKAWKDALDFTLKVSGL